MVRLLPWGNLGLCRKGVQDLSKRWVGDGVQQAGSGVSGQRGGSRAKEGVGAR